MEIGQFKVLEKQELAQVNGGVGWLVQGLVVGAIIAVAEDWDGFVGGVKDGWNAAK